MINTKTLMDRKMVVSLILLFFLFPDPTHVTSAVHPKRSNHKIHTDIDHGLIKTPPKVEPGPSSRYFELTKPLQSDHLTPSCTLSISLTTSARYSPPSDCSSTGWSQVALHVQASTSSRPSADDDQPILPNINDMNDVAALWLGGAELIRMSPPPPQSTELHGLSRFWEARKDITRYSSLLAKSNITLTLTSLRSTASRNESSSWVSPAGPYQANITIFYFEYLDIVTVPAISGKTLQDGFYDERPADLIIPLSNKSRDAGGLSWFRVESEFDIRRVELEVPRNAIRAIMELYVSSHSEDEFWPSHMSRSMSRTEKKLISSKHRPYGAFKEVVVTIDGKIVGSEVPFSVIFPGSINPFFWEPMVAIGAFDHPTYDIDLTPFLDSMVDGRTHEFGIGVSRSSPFWLVTGNLHLWLDNDGVVAEARSVLYHYPALRIEQKSEVKGFERRLQLKAKRKSKFTGWVMSSEGNFTTRVSQETEVKNSIRLGLTGQYIEIEHEIESDREVRMESETGELVSLVTMKRKYPLSIATSVLHRHDRSTYSGTANVTMKEKLVRGKASRVYHNEQYASGWMTVTRDEAALLLSGSGRTEQSLKYRDGVGGGGCCFREAAAEKGKLLKDESTYLCTAL